MCVCVLVAQSCLILCDPSAHGILQAEILEWFAMPSLQGIFLTQRSNPGLLFCRQIFYHWATRGKVFEIRDTSSAMSPQSSTIHVWSRGTHEKTSNIGHYICKAQLISCFYSKYIFHFFLTLPAEQLVVVVCCIVTSCVQLFVTPWTAAHQVPLSLGFSRQEYWSGVPFPSSGHLPTVSLGITNMTTLAPPLSDAAY